MEVKQETSLSTAIVSGDEEGKRDPVKLSVVSKQYDVENKGYLDETEKKLRAMDNDNQGHLPNYALKEIMVKLENQEKRNVTNRNVIIALCVFAVLLSIGNIGTAFAAARLAKDTEVSTSGDFTDKDGNRVATTPRVNEFAVESVPNEDRRRAQQEFGVDDDFEMKYKDAVKIYQEFCPDYDKDYSKWVEHGKPCGGGAASAKLKSCGQLTTITNDAEPTFDEAKEETTYTYNAARGGVVYGQVVIKCEGDNKNDKCVVTGLTCEVACMVCNNIGWWCDPATPYCDLCSVSGSKCASSEPEFGCFFGCAE